MLGTDHEAQPGTVLLHAGAAVCGHAVGSAGGLGPVVAAWRLALDGRHAPCPRAAHVRCAAAKRLRLASWPAGCNMHVYRARLRFL